MTLLATQIGYGADNDFGTSTSAGTPIPTESIKYQMEIKGEILVFDKTGRRLLYKAPEERRWKFGADDKPIMSNWSYQQKNMAPVALQHEWRIDKDGQILVKIKQFESMDRGSGDQIKFGKLKTEKEIQVENFESVSWVVSQDDKQRVVAKFEPVLWPLTDPSDIGALPINSSRMTVFDSKGNLWASRLDNSEGNNIYFGATTHKGSFYISYLPFKGAKEIGTADKGRIRIEASGTKLNIESSDPFLPRGVSAKVYGIVDLNKKSDRFNSVRSYGSSEEAPFLKRIEK